MSALYSMIDTPDDSTEMREGEAVWNITTIEATARDIVEVGVWESAAEEERESVITERESASVTVPVLAVADTDSCAV